MNNKNSRQSCNGKNAKGSIKVDMELNNGHRYYLEISTANFEFSSQEEQKNLVSQLNEGLEKNLGMSKMSQSKTSPTQAGASMSFLASYIIS